jgi:hypothetical protein
VTEVDVVLLISWGGARAIGTGDDTALEVDVDVPVVATGVLEAAVLGDLGEGVLRAPMIVDSTASVEVGGLTSMTKYETDGNTVTTRVLVVSGPLTVWVDILWSVVTVWMVMLSVSTIVFVSGTEVLVIVAITVDGASGVVAVEADPPSTNTTEYGTLFTSGSNQEISPRKNGNEEPKQNREETTNSAEVDEWGRMITDRKGTERDAGDIERVERKREYLKDSRGGMKERTRDWATDHYMWLWIS